MIPNVFFRTVDVSAGAAYLMAPKEENELMVIKKACQVSVDLFNKYLKEQVMEIVDADKKVWSFILIILIVRNSEAHLFFNRLSTQSWLKVWKMQLLTKSMSLVLIPVKLICAIQPLFKVVAVIA